MSEPQPMTARRTAKATGLDMETVSAALRILCAAGLVKRLSTVIVSYAAGNW
jgi:hypothetical protein